MPAARFARLVRFCDERYTARADGLAAAARHFEQSRFKSQSNDAEKRQGWPYPDDFPTRPGRSGVGITRDEYHAWRRVAQPVAYADDIEYITAPDGAARAV